MKSCVLYCTFLSLVTISFTRDIYFETDPRLGDPRLADPRITDPRITDPRITDPSFQRQPSLPPDYTKKDSLISFDKFNTAEEIEDYTLKLAQSYPDLVKVERIGLSHERRPITAVKISTSQPVGANKPVIFIDAGIHAREWAAPAVALYILNQLVENFQNNRDSLEAADWIIVPLVNPDGYAYSMTEDRMWRKNRANTTDEDCPGVDLNRNFDVYFGGIGTSRDPCSEIYAGTSAFSEPESRAIRDIALRYKNKIHLYLTIHSFGKYFLYPWGYSKHLPNDWRDLDVMASKAMKALSKVYGTRYKVGSSGRIMGAATGGSDDWMKLAGGAKYSYTIELPGGGYEGFDLPRKDILPVSTEMWAAVATFAREVQKEDCSLTQRCSQAIRNNRRSNSKITFNENELRRRKDQNLLIRIFSEKR